MNRLFLRSILFVGTAIWAAGPVWSADNPGASGRGGSDKPPAEKPSAEKPADRPSSDNHPNEPRGPQNPPSGERPASPSRTDARPAPPPAPTNPAAELSPKDQLVFVHFMSEHDPNVLKVLFALPASPARRGLAADFVVQWKQMNSITNDDELKSLLAKSFGIQDAICRDMIDLAHPSTGSPPTTRPEKSLQDDVTSLVKNNMAQREHRINKLTDLIKTESDAVASDRRALQPSVQPQAMTDQRQLRITKLTELIGQEQQAVSSEKAALQSDQQSQAVIVRQRVAAYSSSAHRLGDINTGALDARTVIAMFFDNPPKPGTATPAGR